MVDLNAVYSQRITKGENRISKIKRKLITISLVRLLLFLLLITSIFYLYPINSILGVTCFILSIIAFFYTIKLYQKVSNIKKIETFKVEICKNEEDAINHKFSHFSPGDEFIDPNHINSYDLDLFGRGSIFQFINRTVTYKGKELFAEMLQSPILNTDSITQRQAIIKELSEELEWRHDFSANGMLYIENKEESKLFESWEQEQFSLKSIRAASFLVILMPLISLITIAIWIIIGNSALFILSTLIQVIYWFIEKDNIKVIYAQFGKRAKTLQKFGILLAKIEQFKWKSNEGKELYNKLKMGSSPSVEINKLGAIISAFDNRNNMFIGVILNLTFVWDILCCYRLINWHLKNQNNYKLWVDTIAKVDALNSLANYTYNHPEFTMPICTNDNSILSCDELGHPLIHPKSRITNNFEYSSSTNVMIITGANMSGKSTFLRTVGVNMVLGMAGAPVCSSEMKFKPIEVFSNMRTTDSLFDDESYFFAELKRLKAILDEIDKGRDLFIILDEILKGTNSVDKLAGSQKLVRRLIKQHATSIIATHDLKLTEIESESPDNVVNKCFEIDIINDEMNFDYQLQDGVTTVMNATFLMKKMGIIQ